MDHSARTNTLSSLPHKVLFAVVALLLSFLVPQSVAAQRVTGTVADERGQAVEAAEIVLLTADSTYIGTATTLADGTFAIDAAGSAGGHILVVSALGFDKAVLTTRDTIIGTVTLHSDTRVISTVVVKADRLQRNAAGYAMNVSGSGLEDCEQMKDLLEFLPCMTVRDGQVQLLGRAPVIYVNGIRVTSQEELAAVRPSRVERVEVDYLSVGEGVTNKGGVIRITTKRERDGAYSGYLYETVDLAPSYGLASDRPTFGLDASMGRWALNYWAYYDHRKFYGDSETDTRLDDGTLTRSDSRIHSWAHNFNNRLNLSCRLSDRATIAFSDFVGNTDIRRRQHNSVVSAVAGTGPDGGEAMTAPQDDYLHGPDSRFTQQAVAKYTLLTDTLGSALEVTADHLYTSARRTQREDLDGTRLTERRTGEATHMARVQPNYTLKFSNGGELQAGADYQYTHFADVRTAPRVTMEGHTPSLYANYTRQARRVGLTVGLTAQHTAMRINTAGTRDKRDNDFLCPQASLMWLVAPERGTMLMLTYQRGIEDMPYSVLSSYRDFETPVHYSTGNTALRTPSNHQATLRLDLDSHVALTVLYYRINGSIIFTHETDPDDARLTRSRPENAHYEQLAALQAEASYDHAKWWKARYQLTLSQQRASTRLYTTTGKVLAQADWANTLRFTPTFGGSLSAHWESGTSLQDMSWRPVGNIDAGLWTTLCRRRLRLSVQSTIWARGRKSVTSGDGYTERYANTTNRTRFSVSVLWQFAGKRGVRQGSQAESTQQYKQIEEKK